MDGTMGQVSETISSDRCTWTVNTVVLGGVSEALVGTGGGTGGDGSRVDRPGQAGWVSPGACASGELGSGVFLLILAHSREG